MSDAYEIRQKPTEAKLIANGDTMMALHNVDRMDARIDIVSLTEAVDALRYWIGEAHALREESNPKADPAAVVGGSASSALLDASDQPERKPCI